MKYQKITTVEATQWFKNGDHPNDESMPLVSSEGEDYLSEGLVVRRYRHPKIDGQHICSECNHIMHEHGWIDCGGDGRIVCVGDYVVTDGHKTYPVKPESFEAIFDPINSPMLVDDCDEYQPNAGEGGL